MGKTEQEDLERRAAILEMKMLDAKAMPDPKLRVARVVSIQKMLDALPSEAKRKGLEQVQDSYLKGGAAVRVGRRADLMTEESFDKTTLFVKLTICGSGYAEWATTTAEAESGWEKTGSKVVGFERDRGDKGWEIMLAGTGGKNTKGFNFKGIFDSGSNAISDLQKEGVARVKSIVGKYGGRPPKIRPVYVLIRAHSRGGVAGTMVSDDLKSAYGDRLTVELVDFDPVPGPDMVADEKKRKSSDERYNKIDISAVDDSTIVYSIASGHQGIFTPQQVTGAKRIIISKQNHSVGLTEGFIWEVDGQKRQYRGSALNSLPEGIFIDRNDTGANSIPLELVMSREQFASEVDAQSAVKVDKKIKGTEKKVREVAKESKNWVDIGRMQIIDRVLKAYYFGS